jgi:hypothetical protein
MVVTEASRCGRWESSFYIPPRVEDSLNSVLRRKRGIAPCCVPCRLEFRLHQSFRQYCIMHKSIEEQ